MEKISDYLKIRVEDLRVNPTARVAICMCLDVSGSMASVDAGNYVYTGRTAKVDGKVYDVVEVSEGTHSRIEELQEGINNFYQAILNDEIAQEAAEICVVTFADEAKCAIDFANIYRQETPKLEVGGMTSMGEGVNLALELLEKRKQEFKDAGVDYYQPWLVLMTDGEPNGDLDELQKAMARTTQMVNERKLTIFPIGIGDNADLDTLSKFSPKRHAMKLKGLKFSECFEWLSSSVRQISNSTPGESVPLNLKAISNWGEKYSQVTKKIEDWPEELP